MATSIQLLSLIQAHYLNDDEQFKTIALQIAASEANKGHIKIAQRIKDIVIKPRLHTIKPSQNSDASLITFRETKRRMRDLVVSEKLEQQINHIVLEFVQRGKLSIYGYTNRRKILMIGSPGTGKTLTASVLSSELKLPLYVIQTDKLISKYMGETGTKLHQIFDGIYTKPGVYFFDEFDSIGSDRSADNDVKEMHRVLNLFLQFIEQDESDSIILAATNNGGILDQALFRRFDDVLMFGLPTQNEIGKLFKLKLSNFRSIHTIDNNTINLAYGLCHADITKACENSIKYAILHDQKYVSNETLIRMIKERKDVYKSKEL